jgi:hypothetical protein
MQETDLEQDVERHLLKLGELARLPRSLDGRCARRAGLGGRDGVPGLADPLLAGPVFLFFGLDVGGDHHLVDGGLLLERETGLTGAHRAGHRGLFVCMVD